MINLCALTKYVLSRIIIDSTYSQKLFNVFFLKLEISVYDLRCCSSNGGNNKNGKPLSGYTSF